MGFLWATPMSSATAATMHHAAPPGRGCHQVFPAILVLEAEATWFRLRHRDSHNVGPPYIATLVHIPGFVSGITK